MRDGGPGPGPGRIARWLLQRAAARRGLGPDADGRPLPVDLPGVERLDDLAYGPAARQRLDVYRRPGRQPAPVLAYLHGGGWRRGDKAMPRLVAAKAAHWTARGAVFVALNTRLLPEAGVDEQADDLARALAFVQREAARWGGNAQRLALLGHSAGAHLTALVTVDRERAAAFGLVPWQASVAIDTAVFDVEAVMQRPHFDFYDAPFGADPAYWRRVSPRHRLEGAPLAPLLLLHSSLREDSAAAAAAFGAAVAGQGGSAECRGLPLTHRELNDTLGLPGPCTELVDGFLARQGWRAD